MSKFFSLPIFKSGIFWTLFITFLFSLMVLFVFPYFFESFKETNFRLLIAFSVFLSVAVLVLLYVLFFQEKTQKMLKERKEKRDAEREKYKEVNERIQDIKDRFKEAITILKRSTLYRNKRWARYELPWYLLVGQQNEGKTTLLEASGLDFPLNVNYEDREVKEVGSTKHFQWYYAEHAVFIDMPGKYIHQTEGKDDAMVWQKGFLNLFAKKRSRRPINGIVLNISVETLLTKSEKELEQYGKDLRDRFDELSKGFVSSIPIYLIVTKSDLIEGYNEYFSTLSEDEKEEVLGMTFDDPNQSIDTTVVKPEFEKLLKRINSSVIDKLHHEWDESSRAKIVLFCDEFANVFDKINMFIDVCFSQTRYRKSLMLRGVYFTSVPEEQAVANPYLLGDKKEANQLEMGRSNKGWFIHKLLRNVIFPESDLINMDLNYKEKTKRQQIAALAASFVFVIVASIMFINDFIDHNNLLHELQTDITVYAKDKDIITQNNDFEEVSVLLNEAEQIVLKHQESTSSNFYKIAFYDVDDRSTKLYNLYQQSLATYLLPRVEQLLNTQILDNIEDYDRTWKNTEAYLMLNNEEHREAEILQTMLGTLWSRMYPNKPTVQRDLNRHFETLLKLGFTPYTLDKNTLKTARNTLTSKGVVTIVYNGLKEHVNETMNLENFNFSQVLGGDIASFEGANYLVPGLFTKQGYQEVIVEKGKNLTKEVLQNNWVLGARTDFTTAELNELYSKVLSLYFKEYKKHWLTAMNSLNVPKKNTISELSSQLETLGAGNSPIVAVLKEIKLNTEIYTPAEELMMKSKEQPKLNIKAGKMARIAAKNTLDEAKKVMSNVSIKNVRDFFEPYNALLDKNGAMTANLQNATVKLNEVFQKMTTIYGAIEMSNDAYKIVVNRINGKHEPIVVPFTAIPTHVEKWYKQTLKHNWDFLLAEAKNHIEEKFKEDVIVFYNEKLKGKYPLARSSSSNSIRIEDFSDFFKADGIMDTFYRRYIANFVKVHRNLRSYSYKEIDGSTLEFTNNFMSNVLRSYQIRKSLFKDKGRLIGTVAYIKPNVLERNLATLQIEYDDNTIMYEHGPIKNSKIYWPENHSKNSANFMLYDLKHNKVADRNKEGEWALFKLIETFKVKEKSKSLIEFEYKKDNYLASMYLKGSMAKMFTRRNPLKSFRLSGNL